MGNEHHVKYNKTMTILSSTPSIHHTTPQEPIPMGAAVMIAVHQGWQNEQGGYDIVTQDTGIVTDITNDNLYVVGMDMASPHMPKMMVSRNIMNPITEDERQAIIATMPAAKRAHLRR